MQAAPEESLPAGLTHGILSRVGQRLREAEILTEPSRVDLYPFLNSATVLIPKFRLTRLVTGTWAPRPCRLYACKSPN